jgi:hypothetical protein
MVTDQKRGLHKPRSIPWKAVIGLFGSFGVGIDSSLIEEQRQEHSVNACRVQALPGYLALHTAQGR